jgi:hypothetical protein
LISVEKNACVELLGVVLTHKRTRFTTLRIFPLPPIRLHFAKGYFQWRMIIMPRLPLLTDGSPLIRVPKNLKNGS